MAALTASRQAIPTLPGSRKGTHKQIVPVRGCGMRPLHVVAFREEEDPRTRMTDRTDAYSNRMTNPRPVDNRRIQEENQERVQETLNRIQEQWDRLADKRTAIALIAGSLLTVYVSNNVLSALRGVPILPGLFTLVGLGYSANFFWKYVLFKSGREELRGNLRDLFYNVRDSLEGEGQDKSGKERLEPPKAIGSSPVSREAKEIADDLTSKRWEEFDKTARTGRDSEPSPIRKVADNIGNNRRD